MSITIRPAQLQDLNEVVQISTHYIFNTVINFSYHAPTPETVISSYKTTKKRQLPYLVAVEAKEDTNESNEEDKQGEKVVDRVVGYTYVSPFPSPRLAYAHTLELSIFVHHEYQNRGVGSMLMVALLDELEVTQHRAFEPGYEEPDTATTITTTASTSTMCRIVAPRKLIAKMSYDTNGPERETSERLRQWYIEKWEFEEVGRMKEVGYKFDRYIDTIDLILDLETYYHLRRHRDMVG